MADRTAECPNPDCHEGWVSAAELEPCQFAGCPFHASTGEGEPPDPEAHEPYLDAKEIRALGPVGGESWTLEGPDANGRGITVLRSGPPLKPDEVVEVVRAERLREAEAAKVAEIVEALRAHERYNHHEGWKKEAARAEWALNFIESRFGASRERDR